VSVIVDLSITYIKELDERSQILWINGFMSLSWKDEYLMWNSSIYGGVTEIFLPSDQIWLPDVVVYNTVGNIFDIGGKDSNALVNSNGTVKWYPGGHYRTLCPVDVRKYPMDVQICGIEIVQWYSHNSAQILVPFADEIYYDRKKSSTEWRLIQTDVQSSQLRWEEHTTDYSTCIFRLTLAREPIFVMLNIIFPVVLLAFLNVLVFRLPAASGEKMTLCFSVLISFAVFVTAINDVMPKVSNKVSFLEIYLCFQLAMSGLTIGLTVWILQLYNKPSDECVPAWLQRIATCSLRNKVGCCGCYEKNTSERKSSGENSSAGIAIDFNIQSNTSTTQIVTWNCVGKSLDHLLFCLFLALALLSTAMLVIVLAV
jgi:nicotinic acetylcholine receptor